MRVRSLPWVCDLHTCRGARSAPIIAPTCVVSNRSMMRLVTLAAALVLSCAWSVGHTDGLPESQAATLAPPALDRLPTVDRVVVRKAERRLVLMHGGNIVRSYKVALGLNPQGQKERAGDFRTPEGSYHLDRRNPRSDFFLSIKVSYPNDQDIRRARARHWDTGGSIMIHGLPNP